jgi:hypothetical protein
VTGEEDPLDPAPTREMPALVAAIRHLEAEPLETKETR